MKRLSLYAMALLATVLTGCRKDVIEPQGEPEDEPEVIVPTDKEILRMVKDDVPNTAFYKDIFLDGGCNLNPGVKVNGAVSNGTIPWAVKELGMSYEYFLSRNDDPFATASSDDRTLQASILGPTPDDPNGVLLYPDGNPRFRMYYAFGGSSGNHGTSLGATVRGYVKQFYQNGGCYAGSCAGAYLSCKYASGSALDYFNLLPGANMVATGLSSSSTYATIAKGSALLNYADFGGDMRVDNIRHNGGGYLDISRVPGGTEVLAHFGTCPGGSTSAKYYGKPHTWAYKEGAYSGRLVVCGSHPEDASSGEVLDFTKAIFQYAYEGVGNARIKGILHNGEPREMTQYDNADFCPVGDLQCHHFVFYLPKKADVLLQLTGDKDYNLELYIKKGTYAFPEAEPDAESTAKSYSQVLSAELESGLWYVCVRCSSTVIASSETTVPATGKGHYFKYTGNKGVLKGVPYTISVKW